MKINKKSETEQDHTFSLRPKNLNEFIGKKTLIESIRNAIQASKINKRPLDHILFYGPAGVGKTSLAYLIAKEMGSDIKIVQSVNIQNIADLLSMLSSIKENDFLFIDEIHNLKKKLGELLYPPLEDGVIDLIMGKGYNSKILRLKMPKFTLIGATTNYGALPAPLEERFGYHFYIDSYTDAELAEMVLKTGQLMNLNIDKQWIEDIVLNSRGIPRNCKKILKRIKDYQCLLAKNSVSKNSDKKQGFNLKKILLECGYIFNGITEIDYKYLKYLGNEKSKTAGINTLFQALMIDEKTILNKIEPFLIGRGLIKKVKNGRQITEKGEISLKKCHEALMDNIF